MSARARVDGPRLLAHLEILGAIGRREDGLHRPAFGDEDLRARRQVVAWMEAAGLTVRVDALGNVIGRREGRRRAGALATGSHIDTVPGAGRYDGAYGVLAGIAVAHALQTAGEVWDHALEVIAFSDEEGSFLPGGLTGSRAMAGRLDAALLDAACAADPSWPDRVRRAGGDLDRWPDARRAPGDIAAYVELHVEQGPILERNGVEIGIVTGVTGRHVFRATVNGAANHAGTTPMDLRHDALVAAAELIAAVRALAAPAAGEPQCRTATVGAMRCEPGAVNVVPGRAILDLELRDVDMGRLDRAGEGLRQAAERLAMAHGVEILLERRTTVVAAPAAPRIQAVAEQEARAAGCTTLRLPSGAGHDAQAMAWVAPMGMIFVPSAAGISHSGDEYTGPADCVRGAEVLLATLAALDAGPPVPLLAPSDPPI